MAVRVGNGLNCITENSLAQGSGAGREPRRKILQCGLDKSSQLSF
jgi:hypothetical protein